MSLGVYHSSSQKKNVRCGWLESPLCDNYTCLVFIILSGCVVALTTFIAHSSWYITVRQNILKYRCMQWEIGILLRIFAGFTTTKAFKKSIIKCGHIPRHYLWQSMLLIYYIFKSSVFERLCCVVSKPPKISSWTSTYIFDLIRWLAMALFSRRFEFFFACYLTYICIWNT